ncbi:transglutaminase superfamily protein [Herbinix hemicellulosilytica]|uniref:Transglutaminase superfamily protein n=1 Tax=Herbinix hemicellulosilytica TaxID=1564487 RepID=A0A0H5SEH2_HERHM|nr:transglutaminase domain-containing protein [Herbinix hemicellulosilytica]RBP60113.1 transglutaminase superfamily protein [Herbinix hemicellulosilytica]CRZ33837.1 hypothetical protein HHT355_0633 [Herbinix hemicellulosilytica]
MRNRRRKRKIQVFLMLLDLFVLILVISLAYMKMKPAVVKAVTVEAGTGSINIKDFLTNKRKNGSFVTDINNINLNIPGAYEIKIKINGRIYKSKLEIVDTVAPKADPVSVIALKDQKIEATDFITNLSDATEVTVSFEAKPDTSIPGEKDVNIILKDMGNNRTVISSKLTVLNVKSSVQVEAGTKLNIKASDFADDSKLKVNILSDLSKLDISKPAIHTIQLEVDGLVVESKIEVVDTTPPKAVALDKEVWKGDVLAAQDFVTDISDASDVKVTFAEEPDFETLGTKEITIILEDTYGNKSEVKSMLTVKEDTEPPVFSGIKNQIVYVGDKISYKKGVSVKDNKDTDISFQVDSSNVNLNKAGTYKVYYIAEDSSGNKAKETATITVLPLTVTEEMLNEKVDKILAKIMKEGMTKREIAWEIYQWVKKNVVYTGYSDKSDWRKEAYRGIVTGMGDCFTYYAISEALLTRAGIDNMRVTRVGGKTEHFWNLINCGDGWYHFDSCPNKDKRQTFMLTDAEVEELTRLRGNNYYTFDKSLYPRTPEK